MKTLRKGALLALGVAALAFALLRPLLDASPVQAQAPRQTNETGRFTLLVTPPVATGNTTYYAVPYVLDTRTGQVWVHNPAATVAGKVSTQWTSLGSPAGAR